MTRPLAILLFLFSVFISSISQIMLKKSTGKKYNKGIKEYLNPLVISAYLIFFGATFLTIFALKNIPLSFAPVLEATGYIWIILFGYIFLKEKLNLKKWIGLLLIIVGMCIISL